MKNLSQLQNGDNWIVLVIQCPISIVDKILIDIFELLEANNDVIGLPH